MFSPDSILSNNIANDAANNICARHQQKIILFIVTQICAIHIKTTKKAITFMLYYHLSPSLLTHFSRFINFPPLNLIIQPISVNTNWRFLSDTVSKKCKFPTQISHKCGFTIEIKILAGYNLYSSDIKIFRNWSDTVC